MLLEISLLIISIAFLLLVLFFIPVLMELRRTLQRLDFTVETLNRDLPGILRNVVEITDNTRLITRQVNVMADETLRKVLPVILTNIEKIATTLSGTAEAIRLRIEGFAGGAQSLKRTVVNYEERVKKQVQQPIAAGLRTFAKVVNRFRIILEKISGKGLS
jgi:uncharacterized protein YoxC